MLSTGSSGTYHRLDGANVGPSASLTPASTPMPSSIRPSPQSLPPTSTPFPIAPAPSPQTYAQSPPPMMPYPQQPSHVHVNPQTSQSQIVCTGCRTLLVYPNNATNVRCAICSTITPVPQAGTEMSQLVCGGCRTLLMYVRGASSVQCSCCHTVNLALESNQVAHVNCGGCGMTLMYAYGAQSVKCAVCQFVTNIGVGAARMPIPVQRTSYSQQSSMGSQQPHRTQTVVVENPMTLDDTGKLVNNVSVGLTEKKS